MATNLKVSFPNSIADVIDVLAKKECVTPYEYVRGIVEQHVRQKQGKIRYRALRYAEPAAIVMDYISSDYDISDMMFTNLNEQQVRNKVVTAANDVMEWMGNDKRCAGLKEVQHHIADLSRGARSIIDEVKRQTF